MDNFSWSAGDQIDDFFLSLQESRKSLSAPTNYQLVWTQAVIRGYSSRKSTCQDQLKQRAEIICDLKAFKAYFNSKINDKIYRLLKSKGMYFKDISSKWIGPSPKGANAMYIGELDSSETLHGYGAEILLSSRLNSCSGIYEGKWYHGEYHGKGRLLIDPGTSYLGDWKEGKKHGKGMARFQCGMCYTGQWKDDKPYGFGHSWNAKEEHWEGQFQSGLPHGLIRNWGSTFAYYGYFKNGKRHGNGWIVLSENLQYIGGFLDGQPNGKGSFRYSNGNYSKSCIVNSKKTGPGILAVKDVGVYKGQFENDKAIGDFLLTKISGETQKFITIEGHFLAYMDEILTNLYLGSKEAAQDVEELRSKGIRNIVRVLVEEEKVQMNPEFNYHIISIKDDLRENISKYFQDAIKFIHTAILSNEKVLVHCFRGLSRSSTIVLAYIMASQKCDFKSALKQVKQKRKLVNPNPEFIKQLKSFDFNNIAL